MIEITKDLTGSKAVDSQRDYLRSCACTTDCPDVEHVYGMSASDNIYPSLCAKIKDVYVSWSTAHRVANCVAVAVYASNG
jgi:hypothetical protein